MLEPLEHAGSPSAHMSMVFAAYGGPIGGNTAPDKRFASALVGLPGRRRSPRRGRPPGAAWPAWPNRSHPRPAKIRRAPFWCWGSVPSCPVREQPGHRHRFGRSPRRPQSRGSSPGKTPIDRPEIWEPSESTNAWPTLPTPGGWPVPRANATSTAGHGSACTAGLLSVPPDAADVTAIATQRTRRMRWALTAPC